MLLLLLLLLLILLLLCLLVCMARSLSNLSFERHFEWIRDKGTLFVWDGWRPSLSACQSNTFILYFRLVELQIRFRLYNRYEASRLLTASWKRGILPLDELCLLDRFDDFSRFHL